MLIVSTNRQTDMVSFLKRTKVLEDYDLSVSLPSPTISSIMEIYNIPGQFSLSLKVKVP